MIENSVYNWQCWYSGSFSYRYRMIALVAVTLVLSLDHRTHCPIIGSINSILTHSPMLSHHWLHQQHLDTFSNAVTSLAALTASWYTLQCCHIIGCINSVLIHSSCPVPLPRSSTVVLVWLVSGRFLLRSLHTLGLCDVTETRRREFILRSSSLWRHQDQFGNWWPRTRKEKEA